MSRVEPAPGMTGRRGFVAGGALATAGLFASRPTPAAAADLPVDPAKVAAAHQLLRERFVRSRGGVIGTGGKAVVAFRWDHNPVPAIESGLIELHRQYEIPLTWAHYSQQVEIDKGNWHSTPWSTLEEFALFDGMEVGCHSQTHQDATDDERLTAEIVTSLAELSESLPSLMIEWFIIPGVGGTNYNGFISTNSPARWYDTPAGQLVLQTYAMCSGHMGGSLHPLAGQAPIGQRHHGIETSNAADTIELITRAQTRAAGLCLMLHPVWIGRSDHMSLDDYEAVLAHVAAERDAGRLLALTMSGLAVADSSRGDHRDQLLDGLDWQGTGGWTADGWTIEDGVASTSEAGSSLRTELDLALHADAIGGVRELAIECRSRTGATVQVQRWTDTRERTIPAGEDWQVLRLFGVIPKAVASYPLAVVATSGSVEIRSVELLAT